MAEVKKSSKAKTKTTSVSDAKKLGRNSDGTFKEGNRESVGNKGGRPMSGFSAREIAKAMADDLTNGGLTTRLQSVIVRLYGLADAGDVNAIDKIIKLTGNYDPQETKDVTPIVRERPFKGLTVEQISKFLGDGK